MSNSVLKQIACIGAYAAGFSIGTYGALKAVEAIEKKWPMKNGAIRISRSSISLHVSRVPNKDMVEATLTTNGEAQLLKGTAASVRAQLRKLGHDELAMQI